MSIPYPLVNIFIYHRTLVHILSFCLSVCDLFGGPVVGSVQRTTNLDGRLAAAFGC